MSAAAGALATIPIAFGGAAAANAATTTLSGAAYASKFTRTLPKPQRIDLAGPWRWATITAKGCSLQVLDGYPATNMYGYEGSWPGPTVVGYKNVTAKVKWRNALPTNAAAIANGGHIIPVDPTLLEADLAALPAGQLPLVTHLHGGHTESDSDGYPEAWYSQNYQTTGMSWKKAEYTYDNSQVSTALWYHDHTMGITAPNNYAGLQGMYLIRDVRELELVALGVLPAYVHEQELMIADRSFTDDGQLRMDVAPGTTNGTVPSVFFDFMMVNGAPWPNMNVEQRKYRFRMLNGSDSRFLMVSLSNKQTFFVVGSDQGLLPNAVEVTQLQIAPGERYDVVIDFSAIAIGTTLQVINTAPDNVVLGMVDAAGNLTNIAATGQPAGLPPFIPGGPPPSGPPKPVASPADPNSTGKVMQFTVAKRRSFLPNASVKAGTKLAGPLPKLTATNTRGVLTYFGQDAQKRGMEMLGSLTDGTAMWMDPVTEKVALGTTEIWEIYNNGPVSHPVHIHLVNFQVLDRAPFTATLTPMDMGSEGTGAMMTVNSTGTRRAPEPWETGRKDTVVTYPGEVTRVIATFDRPGSYVWHCHILHHEDHGMMRPITVS